MLQTALKRWMNNTSYDLAWSGRSDALLAMYTRVFPDWKNVTFSEYGCGPHAPFAKSLGPEQRCIRYDLRAWDEECRIVNLNDWSLQVEKTDVAVLSGVLEYMNSISKTISALSRFHRFMLVSYHPVSSINLSQRAGIEEIRKRAEMNGWRNHLSLAALLSEVSDSCFLISAAQYKKQALLLFEVKD